MKCDKNHLAILSLMQAAGVYVYIFFLILFMNQMDEMFMATDELIAPLIFLTLFVVSAAITGGLVLGKPILMYIEGKKKEAVNLFVLTLAWLLIFVAISVLFMTYI